MSNLSKISAVISSNHEPLPEKNTPVRWKFVIAAISFPVIAGALFAGNELSAQHKQDLLINSAQKLISENQPGLASLSNYQFTPAYIDEARNTLSLIKKIDNNLPQVMIIFPGHINEKKLFLAFDTNSHSGDDENKTLEKASYIYSASQDERAYLEKIFTSDDVSPRFQAQKGNYQLYFPTVISGKKIVLYFSDHERYGKFGSS